MSEYLLDWSRNTSSKFFSDAESSSSAGMKFQFSTETKVVHEGLTAQTESDINVSPQWEK